MKTLEKYKSLPIKRRFLFDWSLFSIPTFPTFCLLIVFLFSFTAQGFTQNYYGSQFMTHSQPTLRAYEKAGAKAFKKADYGDAVEYYRNAIKLDSTKIENYYHLGLAARAFKDNATAKVAFMMVEQLNDALNPFSNYRNAIFYYSIIEKEQGNEDNATVLKEQLDTTFSIPNYTFNKIKNIDEWDDIGVTCDAVLSGAASQITITALDTINTIYSETGPFWRNGKLHYAALKFKKEDDKGTNEQKRIYAKTLQSELNNEGVAWMERKHEKQDTFISMNIPNKTTAHFTFDTTEHLMYFTICDYINKKSSKIQCQIYYRVKTNNGWSEPKPVSDEINVPGYTSTHPAIGLNESGAKTLFYVSDRPGGKGGLDIWQTPILGPNNFGRISPLPANTRKDEITPFYHHKTNTLYFSSQGNKRVKQYDVYKMTNELTAGGWSAIELLPAPINSNADDFGYFLLPDGERGFMVSSRADCNKLENGDWACHDIFQVAYCLPELRIKPIDLETDSTLADVTVTLSILKGKDTLKQACAPLDNFLFTDLDTSLTYLLKVEKAEYDTVFKEVKVTNCDSNEIKIYLEETCKPTLTVNIYDRPLDEIKNEYGQEIPLTNSIIQFNRLTKFEPKKLINDSINPNTFIQFSIDTLTNYEVVITHANYLGQQQIYINTDSINFLSNDCQVSKKVVFLPTLPNPEFDTIACYFDHDIPKLSIDEYGNETFASFDKLLERYNTDSRKATYRQKFMAGAENPAAARKEIDDFFRDNVDSSFQILENFKDTLLKKLALIEDDDDPYILQILGYTSDIGSNTYNDSLADRRVQSVWNYFIKSNRADFEKYVFPETGKAKLIMRPIGLGEDKTKPIFEKEDGYRNTKYNPVSTRKRRVEIIRRDPNASNR